ncbi:hypothetical protein RD792_011641 [Penstemon davidsonii]|uniref:Dirigent protein n=1 Tax=Penstemon davidsonii TaxID=160366 RepID=A0ABR0CVM0_9LAMI|nr:hypothetical protein RD792_011641 [Penstemon davidsonii]
MAKLIIILVTLISILFIAMPNTHAQKLNPDGENKWFQNICNGKESVAKVHFYVQDLLGGENITVYEVARATITSNSPTMFGQVRVLDDLLTAEPDINSQEIVRVQGLITSADLKTSALAMNLNFVFTAGEYNRSTISILGRNQIDNDYRELPVVGGTGIFRMARGYAITNTYSYDAVTNYGVLEYTLYVTYVEDAANIFLANE